MNKKKLCVVSYVRYIIIILLFAHMRNKTNRARFKYKKIFCGGNLFNKIYGYIMVLRLQIYDLRDACIKSFSRQKETSMYADL